MIELLKEQLKEYLLEYKKVNDEMKSLFEKEKFKSEDLKELSKKGAGLKMMIKACVLSAVFGEDDYVEGVFLIEAKSRETFFNRKRKLEEITGFSDGMLDSFEEDEEGGVWKVITTAWFENVEEIKKALGKMKKYNWLFLSDSSILFEGIEIYCDGQWLV
jgi:hypothetical protein